MEGRALFIRDRCWACNWSCPLPAFPTPASSPGSGGGVGAATKARPTCASLCQPCQPLAQSLGLLWALP